MYLPYGFDACSREFVPFDCYISASLSCLWFVQGSLFPLISVQQACLAYVLFKGLCTLFLVLLVPSVFLIYNILTFDKKKKEQTTFMAIYGEQSTSLLSLIQQIRSYEESVCHLALFLASKALSVSDPHFLEQYSNTWSRVARSPDPPKRALVAARPDLGLLVDAPPTLDGASGGGSSLASTMAFVTACIYGIFCSPSFSANPSTLSVSIIGLLHHWVPRSRSGRCCPSTHSCFSVAFV
jgi:hypothetical protein